MKMRTNLKAFCLAGSIGIVFGNIGCANTSTPSTSSGGNTGANVGGQTGAGGSSASTSAGGSGTSNTSSSSTGGDTSKGGTSSTKSATTGGQGGKNTGAGGSSAATGGTRTTGASTGGATGNTGGATGVGGSSGTLGGGATGTGGSSTKSSVGGSSAGGSGGSSMTGSGGVSVGGVTNIGGTSGLAGATAVGGTATNYMLPPPDQCHDVDYQPYSTDPQTGCISGNTSSKCGGKCQTASVCENTSSKPGADVEYMCPRDMLFSDEMKQAAIDDGYDGIFNYAVVGHDPDQGGIDGNSHTCCQCYQLVYAYPSPNNDREGQINPDTLNPLGSAIEVPPPLIVQSFNTAASATTFDVYMAAGGMGANNGCYPVNGSPTAGSTQYMYTAYPPDGQPGQGGVKPASLYSECRTTEKNWLTEDSLQTPACRTRTEAACGKFASNIPGLADLAEKSCLNSNTLPTFYHLNWSVYAMRIECPEHLTRVTGCKLQPQGLKSAKKDVTTADQAKNDPDFWKKTANTNNLYETTTMEDCCRPTCASYSQISNFGLKTDPNYRSFYNCDSKGVPWTQSQ